MTFSFATISNCETTSFALERSSSSVWYVTYSSDRPNRLDERDRERERERERVRDLQYAHTYEAIRVHETRESLFTLQTLARRIIADEYLRAE